MYSSKSLVKESSLKQWLPIAIVMGLAIILRLYQLGTESVLYDEMLSIRDAENFQFTFPYIRPLYFMLLKFWMQFGSSDVWFRSISLIFGTGAIWLTYRLGCRVVGQSTGVIAALIMALSPLFINHSQEIRMYGLIKFLSVGGTLALCHFLERPSFLSLGIWTVARIGLLLSNANNVLILLPDTILLAWQYRKQWRWLLISAMSMGLICLAFLPVAIALTTGGSFGNYMESTAAEYSKPGLILILGELTQMTVYWPMRHLLKSNQVVLANNQLSDDSLLSNLLSTQTLSLLFYAGFTLVLIAVMGIALFSLIADRRRSEKLRWVAIWAILPTICSLIISYTSDPIWKPRYLLFVDPYFLILLATGFIVVWHWRRALALFIAIAYFIAVSGGLNAYYTTLYRTDWKGAIAEIMINEQPNDAIMVYAPPLGYNYAFKRYYQGSLPVYRVGPRDQIPRFKADQQAFRVQSGESESSSTPNRLWLLCWSYCQQSREMDQLTQILLGESFEVKDSKTADGMESDVVRVDLRTPTSDQVTSIQHDHSRDIS
ncbi:MAG: glycosyltransferase family 39 protein [Cyanobacteriota bacterium]|nr:glycosyltransferase family 39 protein [Cyanobacteriota bacterium]